MSLKNSMVDIPPLVLAVRFRDDFDALQLADEFIDECLPILGKPVQIKVNNSDLPVGRPRGELKQAFRITPKGVFGRFSFFTKTDDDYYCGISSPPNDGPLLRISSAEEKKWPQGLYGEELIYLARRYSEKQETTRLSIFMTLSSASSGWVPDAPGSPSSDLVRLIRIPSSLKRSYPDPTVYWAAWDRQEVFGERMLFSRALDVESLAEYRQSVYPRIWELARRAYPGQCTYYSPTFRNAEERTLFNEGPQTIRLVGYNAELQIAEATCYVDDGQHIAPREILGLREALLDGQLPDGRSVKTIRVVFPSKEMAMQEGVPLLDVGVTVVYLDRQMQDQLLTAEDYTALA